MALALGGASGPFRNAINLGGSADYYDLQIGSSFIAQWDGFKSGADKKANRAALQLGLGGDAYLDFIKGESIRDEGHRAPVNPLNSFRFLPAPLRRGPERFLPGIKKHKVDVE